MSFSPARTLKFARDAGAERDLRSRHRRRDPCYLPRFVVVCCPALGDDSGRRGGIDRRMPVEPAVGLLVAVSNTVLVAIDRNPLAGAGRRARERHGLIRCLREGDDHRL